MYGHDIRDIESFFGEKNIKKYYGDKIYSLYKILVRENVIKVPLLID